LHIGVNDTNVPATAVSMTPLCITQRYQWHHYATIVFSNIFANNLTHCFFIKKSDSAAHSTTVSLTLVWHAQQYQWHHCDMHSGINDTAKTCTVLSMTPLWPVQWCQWHHCANMTPLWLWTSPLCKYDTALTLDLTFQRLWLPLKGISIEKTYTGKLSYTKKYGG
jgi:hypothetical protein